MAERLVAVTGPGGRLGREILRAFEEAHGTRPVAWRRPDYDLDDLEAAERLVERDQPSLVVHTAAWTDVDGCAKAPELAMHRNGAAVGALARACVARDVDLVVVSTNEVFDGRRVDGQGYGPDDEPEPINPYGASKLEGETQARAAYASATRPARLAIVRTSWLFGPPGNDFPTKILAAAEAADDRGEPLRVVDDEFASPTSAADLAVAIHALTQARLGSGIHHVVNEGTASRYTWATSIIRAAGRSTRLTPVSSRTWIRPSTPPAWGVLAPTPLPGDLRMPSWQAATEVYVATLSRAA